jgi:hypothetical protein
MSNSDPATAAVFLLAINLTNRERRANDEQLIAVVEIS